MAENLENGAEQGLMAANGQKVLGGGGVADPSQVLVLEEGVVIPADLARPIVYSSQLILLTALFAALSRMWLFCALSIALWFTSWNFWRDPRMGWRRNMDYVMVATNLIYGTVVAFYQPLVYCLGWFGFILLLAVVFGGNETKFWLNNAKTRADYKRTVCVHLTGVHIIGNIAGWWLLYGIWKSGNRCCQ